jgi:gamma-glutamyl phosphate reductase
VTTKQKRTYQKKAAGCVADLILDSLERFPEKERAARLKCIHAALNNLSARIAAKNYIQKLEKAAKRTTEIVLEQMSTLTPEKAKTMREEIRRLAARRHKK